MWLQESLPQIALVELSLIYSRSSERGDCKSTAQYRLCRCWCPGATKTRLTHAIEVSPSAWDGSPIDAESLGLREAVKVTVHIQVGKGDSDHHLRRRDRQGGPPLFPL